jgi:hypothetical protein
MRTKIYSSASSGDNRAWRLTTARFYGGAYFIPVERAVMMEIDRDRLPMNRFAGGVRSTKTTPFYVMDINDVYVFDWNNPELREHWLSTGNRYAAWGARDHLWETAHPNKSVNAFRVLGVDGGHVFGIHAWSTPKYLLTPIPVEVTPWSGLGSMPYGVRPYLSWTERAKLPKDRDIKYGFPSLWHPYDKYEREDVDCYYTIRVD